VIGGPWLAAGALLVAFLAGWQVNGWRINSAATEQALEQSEVNREAERIAARTRTQQLDGFARRLQAEQSIAAAAARDTERVRIEADRIAAAARAGTAQPDGATVAGLVELLGEGAGLLEEGRRHLAECGAAREALSRPTSEGGRHDR